MNGAPAVSELRPALSLEVDLGGGSHAASARLELRVGAGPQRGEAHVALRGWIGRVAEQRLMRTLREWMKHNIDRVVLDCRDARHVNRHTAHRLAGAATGTEGVGPVEIWGMPRAARARPISASVDATSPGTRGECGA